MEQYITSEYKEEKKQRKLILNYFPGRNSQLKVLRAGMWKTVSDSASLTLVQSFRLTWELEHGHLTLFFPLTDLLTSLYKD